MFVAMIVAEVLGALFPENGSVLQKRVAGETVFVCEHCWVCKKESYPYFSQYQLEYSSVL
jgi:hypothetical protein